VPLSIEGTTYFSLTEIAHSAGISRQTLWRWRQEGKIPRGHLYRERRILFTADDAEGIRKFANRVEPISADASGQLGLFKSPGEMRS
jgi:hypothetical protein